MIKTIGKGAAGTVFLAEHTALKEPRAVKQVAVTDCDELLTGEARILKSLKHPGIPVVYDIETDGCYIYLIEEFIEGDSLKSLVENKGTLSLAETIDYGCELCRIIAFLHSNKPDPIYYLDLQPNNVLICRGTLKLVDFDRALFKSKTGFGKRYGTPGYAAPELYGRASIDERADIYAIGALLYYMDTGMAPEAEVDYHRVSTAKLAAVLKKCLTVSKEERFSSAAALEKALISLKKKENDNTIWPLLKIAVCGSRPGVGVTHTAFFVSKLLEQQGFNTYVHERNSGKAMMRVIHREEAKPDAYGIYHLKEAKVKPDYGLGVRLEVPPIPVEICDFGTDIEAVSWDDFHLILLLCSSAPWDMDASEDAMQILSCRANLRVIFKGMSSEGRLVFRKKITGIRCFCKPEFMREDSSEYLDFYRSVLEGTDCGRQVFGDSRTRKKSSKGRFSVWDYFQKRR